MPAPPGAAPPGAAPGFDLAAEVLGVGRRGEGSRGPRGRAPAADWDGATDVPWGEGARPRFAVDSMLEGLARLLRLYGVDAAGVPGEVRDARTAERWRVHRALAALAEEEGRVVLTKDRGFLRAKFTGRQYLVAGSRKEEQMADVAARFRLRLDAGEIMSRCSKCNGEFRDGTLTAGDLPPGHGVPGGILERQEAFWECRDCHQIYWEGSKHAQALDMLAERIGALSAT